MTAPAGQGAPAPEPMHLMTIEMGAWCGATGPRFNGRASSQWRDVTCPDCHDRRTKWLLALVWDMLDTMGPSREALAFAVRAGRLGVRTPDDRPLAMACADDYDGRHPDGCTCQFCREDEREERERMDRDDADDSARDALDAQTLHDSPGADL